MIDTFYINWDICWFSHQLLPTGVGLNLLKDKVMQMSNLLIIRFLTGRNWKPIGVFVGSLSKKLNLIVLVDSRNNFESFKMAELLQSKSNTNKFKSLDVKLLLKPLLKCFRLQENIFHGQALIFFRHARKKHHFTKSPHIKV